MDPIALLEPSFTTPPACQAEETVGKFVFPVQGVLEPGVVTLSPLVIEEKSSLKIVVTGPPPPDVTEMDNWAFPVPAEFVAERATFDVPAAVGVPEMTPVEVFTLSPAGRPVAAKDVGELDAVIW